MPAYGRSVKIEQTSSVHLQENKSAKLQHVITPLTLEYILIANVENIPNKSQIKFIYMPKKSHQFSKNNAKNLLNSLQLQAHSYTHKR